MHPIACKLHLTKKIRVRICIHSYKDKGIYKNKMYVRVVELWAIFLPHHNFLYFSHTVLKEKRTLKPQTIDMYQLSINMESIVCIFFIGSRKELLQLRSSLSEDNRKTPDTRNNTVRNRRLAGANGAAGFVLRGTERGFLKSFCTRKWKVIPGRRCGS